MGKPSGSRLTIPLTPGQVHLGRNQVKITSVGSTGFSVTALEIHVGYLKTGG